MHDKTRTTVDIPPQRKGSGLVCFFSAAIGMGFGSLLPLGAAVIGGGWIMQSLGWVFAVLIVFGAVLVGHEWWNEDQPGWRDEGIDRLNQMRAELEKQGVRRHGR